MSSNRTSLAGSRVLLAVTGGVSVYKVVSFASRLSSVGIFVDTLMTESACRFVCPLSFESVTSRFVRTSLWDGAGESSVGHISVVETADIVVVAPATANMIGKVASGICDDLVSTVLCASWSKPTLFVPAMNEFMWTNPSVQRNVEFLRSRGIEFLGPVSGRLACGADGIGRMVEPSVIYDRVESLLFGVE